jgi:HPt (histidine-containing phosphotransfer) domain-containing protein
MIVVPRSSRVSLREGGVVSTDQFAERFEAVRRRFASKLHARIDEIEATVRQLQSDGARDALAHAHRRAHDLCGVGPTMGFVATGQAARSIEQLLLPPLKTSRALTEDEFARLHRGIAVLRSAALAETRPAQE